MTFHNKTSVSSIYILQSDVCAGISAGALTLTQLSRIKGLVITQSQHLVVLFFKKKKQQQTNTL